MTPQIVTSTTFRILTASNNANAAAREYTFGTDPDRARHGNFRHDRLRRKGVHATHRFVVFAWCANGAPTAHLPLEIIIRGAHLAHALVMRIEALVDDGLHAAILAHLQDAATLLTGGAGEHPVAAQLRLHPLDARLRAKQLAAADTGERLLLLEEFLGFLPGLEIELRHER